MTTTITDEQVEAIENAILRVAENAGPFVAFEDAAKILDELNAQGFTIIHSMPATKSEQVECALNVVLKNCVSAIDYIDCYAEHPATTLRQALAQRDDRIEELELSLKNVQDQCDFYEGEMYQNEDAVARDANRIAELEAEVKRKDEALNKYASAYEVTCTYSNYPNSRSYDVYEHCEKWAREALAPKKEE